MTEKPIKIAIAGYSGFIGSAYVKSRKHITFIHLKRAQLYGDPVELGKVLKGASVVINLTGASIARRWTSRNKKEIHRSRFKVNTNLVAAIKSLEQKPELFISASAIGIYDHTGIHTESAHKEGIGFLADVVRKWEEPLSQLDGIVKTAKIRIGLVLGREGGALVPLIRLTKFGLLPIMGSGKQIYSFIHLEDVLNALDFICESGMDGIINLCAPNPVDNANFTKNLARLSGVRFTFRVPAFFLRMRLGKAHVLLTEGQHVLPERLSAEGFIFRFPDVDSAMINLLKKP
jgi:uncharacterized protein (TIGR01777 family)